MLNTYENQVKLEDHASSCIEREICIKDEYKQKDKT